MIRRSAVIKPVRRPSGAVTLNKGHLPCAGNRRTVCHWWVVPLVSLCCLTGCTGGGRLEFASLDFQAIDPPPSRVSSVRVQECYWWPEQDGRVRIAMQSQRTPLFHAKLRFQFQLLLALEKLPAGKARNYKLGSNGLQARVRFGPWESHFSSRIGIVALYRESDDRVRGSIRAQTSRVTLQWLGGWGKPVRYLTLGSFTAVRNEQRGRAIAEQVEAGEEGGGD